MKGERGKKAAYFPDVGLGYVGLGILDDDDGPFGVEYK
jgi:hypothetical protein